MNIQDHIRIVPGFPKPGINFYDIATLLAHPGAWKETIGQLKVKIGPYKPDVLMGIEARGFLVAAPLALELGCGFGMIRKKGKLPGQTLGYKYTLEYGEDEIEIQPDLLKKNSNVVIVDDLLATGGTMAAAVKLVEQAGSKVAAGLCIVELDGLNGRKKLNCPFESLLLCPA
ncbi:MAG TPA: adenine phosphoribosyltransferase [Alphaproteobacteria bacterium]|nr:adenine phosphoribosyltransferase [Micavibrio sp.]MBK9562128.1 adenine phosphoribosyltransferase [Micavibrio sp.]HQX27910.1 adenine phosphoribosyltransferase [Alphaproteobacteria bacterium]